MRTIVAGRVAFSGVEFAELALGVDPVLFVGVPGESASERAARLDAARDVLAELAREEPELAEHAARLLAESADESPQVVPFPVPRAAQGRWAA